MFSKAENIYDLFATGKKEEAIVVLKNIVNITVKPNDEVTILLKKLMNKNAK